MESLNACHYVEPPSFQLWNIGKWLHWRMSVLDQKRKFDRVSPAATRLAVTGCDAEPALRHLHGDCTQKIAFADVHAAMAQDRVGGCEMEIEVRQHEMV